MTHNAQPERAPAVSRRTFLRSAAAAGAAAAAPMLIPSLALGADGAVAPSNRLAMAIVGLGSMGTNAMRGTMRNPNLRIVALCDVDASRRERALGELAGVYGADARRSCALDNDFRDVAARDDIDLVYIATPDHWHIPIALAAIRAGKDVYCQKPLTHNIAEGFVLLDAARRHGTVFQTGAQQRSSRNFRFACELVRNGRLGEIRGITVGLPGTKPIGPQPEMPVPEGFDYDMWLGPAPWAPYTEKRCHRYFRGNFDYSGGGLCDWGAHHLDIVQWALGMDRSGPVEVEGRGLFPSDGIYNTAVQYDVDYTYANGVRVWATTHMRNGIRFEGAEGWIFVNRSELTAEPASLLKSVIGPDEIHLYESRNHVENFIECVRSRAETVSPAEVGHRSVTLCHLGNISMRLGRKVKWDPAAQRFVNDEEAERYMGRAMRSPWTL
ncbi:MAG: Gfo/Idh/MocA family oxidoreductase [Candidatus Sumerlaeota bacterium]|nr:Gfo/Idh/MocA family oxidoreductase [Candidatus Sumerlaeota bacterium]